MTRAFPPEKYQKADARALFGAAGEGDAAVVARLLAAGAAADARLAPGGETPLMRAAARGHEDVARALLGAGADVSAQRADGFTPLILAVFFGHEGLVRLLVEHGADAGARTSLGTTAARWAASRGFAEMADLLRAAEPASPRAVAPSADTRVTSAASGASTSTRAVTPPHAATAPDAEVSIFSRKPERRDSRGAAAGVSAVTGGASVSAGASAPDVFASDVVRAGASTSDVSGSNTARSNAAPRELTQPSAAGVSVRRDGQSPAHPSASTFRFGHFLRSWQGSVGTALLLLAFGVAVFAFMRGGTTAREAAPAPSALPTPAPQAAAQVPTPAATQPTPAFPTPDPLGVLPVTDPAYAVPNTAGQPFYIPPQGAPVPVQSNVPGDLTVVSETGANATGEDARAKRKAEQNANQSAPRRGDARGDAGADAETRAPRPTRTPEPEQQRPAPPPAQLNPPSQPPATQPTPGRAKVIPWPPQ